MPRPAVGRLLTATDLGAGWVPLPPPDRPAALPVCGEPTPAASVVGPSGSAVRFAQGSPAVAVPVLAEYVVEPSSPVEAYVDTIGRLERPVTARCDGISGARRQTRTFEEVLPLPRYGDDSVAMLVALGGGGSGSGSEAGYVVVRDGSDLVVVGLGDPGPLDTEVLGHATQLALATLRDPVGDG